MADANREPHFSHEFVAYMQLRKLLGNLGFFLWAILFLIGQLGYDIDIQDTISDYYYTGMRDWFVGIVVAIGLFLICYIGPEDDPKLKRPPISDNWAGNIAGICAIGLAFCPTTPCNAPSPGLACDPTPWQSAVGWAHLAFAFVFFLLMAYFCLWLFTRSNKSPEERSSGKNKRNDLYKLCGIAILVFLGLIIVIMATGRIFGFQELVKAWNIVFWLEAVMMMFFGFSWLVKGETILKDSENERAKAEPAAT